MIEIKKDGIAFDLNDNTVISMEINNAVLDDDIIKGNYSFPFKIPLTPKNRLLLNFPDEVANPASLTDTINVDMWVDGLPIFPNATFKYKSVDSNVVQAYILVGVSTVADYLSITKLRDKMTYTHSFDQSLVDPTDLKAYAKATTTANVDTSPIVFFPVINNGHYANQKQDYTVEYVKDVVYNFYINNDFQVKDTVLVGTQDQASKHPNRTMVPFIYVTYILRQVLQGITLQTNVFETDAELKTLTLINNFCMDRFGPAQGTTNKLYINFMNAAIDLKNNVADMTVGEFIVALKKVFCLYFYKDPFTDKIYFDAFKNVINSPDYDDWTRLALAGYTIEENIGKGLKYLPQAQGDSVLSSTKSMLNVARKSSVQHFASLPSTGNTTGDVRMVEDSGTLFKWFTLPFGPGFWLSETNAFGDYYVAPAEYELKNNMPPCVPQNLTFYPFQNLNGTTDTELVPAMSLPGSYADNVGEQTKNPVLNKLAFYRGMKTSTGGRAYPFGSSHNYDLSKTRVGNYSLAWDGADGLYNVWWKDFLTLKDSTKEVSMQILLDMPTLLNMDLRKKKRIGSNNYLIKKISLQLPLSKPAKVDFWKVD